MLLEQTEMLKFIDSIEVAYDQEGIEMKDKINSLKKIPLDKNEALYVLDLANNYEVIYQRGLKQLLGYKKKHFTFEFLWDIIHPDDIEIARRVTRASTMHYAEHPESISGSILQMSYRRKRSDGTYIKMLSQGSAFNADESGVATWFLIKLTDISFLDKSNNVNWDFSADNLDMEVFNRRVYHIYDSIFTKREIEVVCEIIMGNPNKLISQNLHISEHTVATHRKNIFRKSDCHNVEELIFFCKARGIIPANF